MLIAGFIEGEWRNRVLSQDSPWGRPQAVVSTMSEATPWAIMFLLALALKAWLICQNKHSCRVMCEILSDYKSRILNRAKLNFNRISITMEKY